MSGFTLSVAARRRGGEVLFRDGWLLRCEGDQLVPLCRSFPLPTSEMPVPDIAPLLRLKAWTDAVEETLRWCERINKKLDRKPQPRNQNVMLGTFGNGKVRLSPAYPALHDIEEGEEVFIGSTAEPAEGEFVVVPLPQMHLAPQPPPPPVVNANLYDSLFIDSLLYRSRASTEAGQQKACGSKKRMRAERKQEYRKGIKLLQAAGFNKHSRSVDGAIDTRTTCPRCGCQVFIPHGKQCRKRESLRCLDCSYQVRSKFYEPSTVDEISSTDRSQLAGVANQVKPPQAKPRMSQSDFVARLRQSGMLQGPSAEARRRLEGSALQIVLGWTAEDVRGVHGFEHEKEETIRKRATRLLGALLKAGTQPAAEDGSVVPPIPLFMGSGEEENDVYASF